MPTAHPLSASGHPVRRPRGALLPLAVPFVVLLSSSALLLAQEGGRPRDLEARVGVAIERGREALLPRLASLVDEPRSDYPLGRPAIVLAALLEAGVPPDDARVSHALERLATMDARKTYCAATAVFAWHALLKRIDAGPRRTRALERLAANAHWLVSARSRGGGWTYEKGDKVRRHDFSNTQFAVLALRVALEHGVELPPEPLVEVAGLFLRSLSPGGEWHVLRIDGAPTLAELLGVTPKPTTRAVRVRPGGWAYRAPGGSGLRKPPYPAMTAAGASSLAAAAAALARTRGSSHARLRRETEKALLRSLAWIDLHLEEYMKPGKNLCYTLYSLEKAGDLAGVGALGGRDWYTLGCEKLLATQRQSGSWGGYTDTALALLFLTRASRTLAPGAAPRLVTAGPDGKPSGDGPGDLVYLTAIDGFLPAGALLAHMARSRDARFVAVGNEILRNYDPTRRGDLVPMLLPLWNAGSRLRSFAQRALAEITGHRWRDPKSYSSWHERFEGIDELGRLPKLTAAQLIQQLRREESPTLKARLVLIGRRRELRGLESELIEQLATPDERYRRLVHGVLELWLGCKVTLPRRNDDGCWSAVASAWRRCLANSARERAGGAPGQPGGR